MPFEVMDNVTKKTLVFDNKPTEQDLQEAFGSLETGGRAQPEGGVSTITGKEMPSPRVSHAGATKGYLEGFPVGATIGMGVVAPFTGGMSLLPAAALTGLGAAGGEAYEQLYQRYKGKEASGFLRPAPETVGEAVGKIGFEGVGGAVAEGVFRGGKWVLGKLAGKEAIPKLTEGLSIKEIHDISDKFGLPFTPSQETRTPILSLWEQVARRFPTAAGQYRKIDKAQIQRLIDIRNNWLDDMGGKSSKEIEQIGLQIQGKIDDMVNALTQGKTEAVDKVRNQLLSELGSSENFYQLGRKTKDILIENSQRYHDIAQALYQKAGESIPKELPVKASNVQETAMKYLVEEIRKNPKWRDKGLIDKLADLAGVRAYAQKPEEIDAFIYQFIKSDSKQKAITMQQLKNNSIFENYDFFDAQRQALTKAIRDEEAKVIAKSGERGMAGFSTVEKRMYEDVERAFDTDLIEFAKQTGDPSIIKKINTARNFYRGYKQRFTNPSIQKMIGENPEFIAELITPENITDIRLMKKALGQEGNLKLKQAFSNKLLKDFDAGERFIKNLDNYGDTLKEIYTPKEVSQLRQLGMIETELSESLKINPFFKQLLKTSPEKVVPYIMKPNNRQNVQIIKSILSPDELKEVQSATLENLLMPISKTTELLEPITFAKNVTKYGREPIEELYGKEFTDDIIQLAKGSSLLHPAQTFAKDPTTVPGILTAMLTVTGAGGLGWLISSSPKVMGSLVGSYFVAPYIITKMMLNPIVRKSLVKGMILKESHPEAIKATKNVINYLKQAGIKGGIVYGEEAMLNKALKPKYDFDYNPDTGQFNEATE